MELADYTYYTYVFDFFRRLRREGSVLSRSELDPIYTVQTQNGLRAPCEGTLGFLTLLNTNSATD